MKKPWVVITLIVVASLVSIGGLAYVVHRIGAAKREKRELAAAEFQRQEEINRREAAVAFAEPVAPSPEEAAEFVKVLTTFSAAARAENGPALAAHLDPERLYDELLLQCGPGAPFGDNKKDRASFIAGVRNGAKNLIINPFLNWKTTVIRRIRWSEDRNEAVVIATHRVFFKVEEEDVSITIKIRWWFTHRHTGWKIYDFEDLDAGYRATTIMAEFIKSENLPRLGELRDALSGFRDALMGVMSGDPQAIDDGLVRARRFPFPERVNAIMDNLEAVGQIRRGAPEAALALVSRAQKRNPDCPGLHSSRMICLNLLGRYEEALKAGDIYFAQLGGDEEFFYQRGYALEGLGRPSEAAASYREALDEYSDLKEALDGLRRVLPKDKKAELDERLAKASDPGKLCSELIDLATKDNDFETVNQYTIALRKFRPNDVRGITAQIRRLVSDKKFADAAAEMKGALTRVKANEQTQVVNSYLFAMLGAERAVEAYQTMPQTRRSDAFRVLADDLEDIMSEDGAEEKDTRQLRDLIAIHKKEFPKDPWNDYFEGVLLQTAKEFAKAERVFAQAQAKYLSSPRPKKMDEERDWEADRFRRRRVECLYALKEGEKAYAEVGPAEETFSQLAFAYQQDKNWSALEKMIAAHRQKHPNDRNGPYWAANVLYQRGNYPDAAAAFTRYLADATEKDPNDYMATDLGTRALLRSGKPREAERVVKKAQENRVALALRVAVALANGHTDDAESIVAEHVKNGARYDFLYYDEDFRREVAAPKFAEFRKKFPDTRPKPKEKDKEE